MLILEPVLNCSVTVTVYLLNLVQAGGFLIPASYCRILVCIYLYFCMCVLSFLCVYCSRASDV